MQIEINAEQAETFRKAGVPVTVTYTITVQDVIAAQMARPAVTLPTPTVSPPKPRPVKDRERKRGGTHRYPRGTQVRMSARIDKLIVRYGADQHQRQVMEAVRMVMNERNNEPMLRYELSRIVFAIIGDNEVGRSTSSVLTHMLEQKMLEVVSE
jgi:hypothetical protein